MSASFRLSFGNRRFLAAFNKRPIGLLDREFDAINDNVITAPSLDHFTQHKRPTL